MRRKLTVNGVFDLTFREVEYLSLAALGLKNREIANALCVQQTTVKKTLEKIFKKLNARDRANAVLISFLRGKLNVEKLEEIKNRYVSAFPKCGSSL